MGMVMAVTFSRHGQLFYLDPGGHTPRVGNMVLVPTPDGPEVAQCVWAPSWVSEDIGGLPMMAGFATDEHLERNARNTKRKTEATITARRIIRAHKLPMKVSAVDIIDSRPGVDELVLIYFSAPQRVDFRELVRELSRTLGARIELRQIGDRDAARVMGGIGSCGRDLCCATFLTDFEPVSLRMAKDQDLPLNPLRISGACGKLMCCLKYEHPLYNDFKADAPAVGEKVTLPEGDGTVIAHSVPTDSLVIRMQADGKPVVCPKASVCGSRKTYETMVADGGRRTSDAEPAPAVSAEASTGQRERGSGRRRRLRRRPPPAAEES
jgi:cell fate regulator YaaT (PSP1 superfamily)